MKLSLCGHTNFEGDSVPSTIYLFFDSLNPFAAFLLDFKQLPPAKNAEILCGRLSESVKLKI